MKRGRDEKREREIPGRKEGERNSWMKRGEGGKRRAGSVPLVNLARSGITLDTIIIDVFDTRYRKQYYWYGRSSIFAVEYEDTQIQKERRRALPRIIQRQE